MRKGIDLRARWDALVKAHPEVAPHLSWVCNRMDKGESPLEHWFVMLFAFKCFGHGGSTTYRGEPSPFRQGTGSKATIDLDQQICVAGHRCDFMFTITLDGKSRRIAVECDGHSFHDRTKEQASNDRARDRKLLREGIPTIRFTYSDLVNNPDEMFDDLRQTLLVLGKELRRTNGGED